MPDTQYAQYDQNLHWYQLYRFALTHQKIRAYKYHFVLYWEATPKQQHLALCITTSGFILSGNRTPTTNKVKPCYQQTMSICIQQQWNAIVWTSHVAGWPHWRKWGDCDQLPDRRGSSRVSGTSTLTKADSNSPINSISATEQKTLWNFTMDLFWLICKQKGKFKNDVAISCQRGRRL